MSDTEIDFEIVIGIGVVIELSGVGERSIGVGTAMGIEIDSAPGVEIGWV